MSSYAAVPAATPRHFTMRPSRVLRVIRSGGVASCIKIISSDPRMVEVMAASGVDSIWVCTEHTATNYENIENQARAAKIHDVDLIVRCPRGSYTDHIRGLEADGTGVMVPHVMGLADAKAVVQMTKFPPLGRRACDGGNVDGLHCRIPYPEYLKEANAERFIIHQIEDPEALADLDAIAALPGVDMLFFGPGDYSTVTGKPGRIWDPDIMAVSERVARAARAAGKMAGTVAVPDKFRTLIDMGYNFINIGGDVSALAAYSDERVDLFRAACAGQKPRGA